MGASNNGQKYKVKYIIHSIKICIHATISIFTYCCMHTYFDISALKLAVCDVHVDMYSMYVHSTVQATFTYYKLYCINLYVICVYVYVVISVP